MNTFKKSLWNLTSHSFQIKSFHRFFSATVSPNKYTHPFGIVLDIDGVLFRGRKLLPRVKEALRMLTNGKGKLQVPTVFLTNGTNSSQKEKAQKLSQMLEFEIPAECMIMAHGPLRTLTDLHNKQVLAVGQNNAAAIARSVGFKKIMTIEKLIDTFPHLACTDFSRKLLTKKETAKLRENFQPIEAIVMLGEPLKWETSLQLILDCLLTMGTMDDVIRGVNGSFKQLPLIACNVDLVWMAEEGSPLPRIGHGVFIHFLESLYETLTGLRLDFQAVLGKPTEISYLHAAHILQRQAQLMGRDDVKQIYVIGDNPMSDVLGARLFDRYLRHGGHGRFDHFDLDQFEEQDDQLPKVRSRHVVERCVSVLVETGVYQEGCKMNGVVKPISMLYEALAPGEQLFLRQPNYVESDLYAAVRTILSREGFRTVY
ncbi:unnamed protein product [Caenorhabditis auriculariae]|uniref:Haloacid dehalogenase-like hydrolase domain-containing 5 n=1 Tax=Caenorhabditis auriculariae TaxID=2777116 RepID=A0A8S1HNJ3_9PELO|nr:unnamed protein product [Caenorhabditis auriculariae]